MWGRTLDIITLDMFVLLGLISGLIVGLLWPPGEGEGEGEGEREDK